MEAQIIVDNVTKLRRLVGDDPRIIDILREITSLARSIMSNQIKNNEFPDPTGGGEDKKTQGTYSQTSLSNKLLPSR